MRCHRFLVHLASLTRWVKAQYYHRANRYESTYSLPHLLDACTPLQLVKKKAYFDESIRGQIRSPRYWYSLGTFLGAWLSVNSIHNRRRLSGWSACWISSVYRSQERNLLVKQSIRMGISSEPREPFASFHGFLSLFSRSNYLSLFYCSSHNLSSLLERSSQQQIW